MYNAVRIRGEYVEWWERRGLSAKSSVLLVRVHTVVYAKGLRSHSVRGISRLSWSVRGKVVSTVLSLFFLSLFFLLVERLGS